MESPVDEVGLTTNQNFVRDMPVAYDVLLENIADQSHVRSIILLNRANVVRLNISAICHLLTNMPIISPTF